jgi:hypothetical protein
MNMCKGPGKISEADAARDPRILIDVVRIIIVNEIVPDCLSEHGQCQDHETDANESSRPTSALNAESAGSKIDSVHVWRELFGTM